MNGNANENLIQFAIIDTGIGIPSAKLETVFEKFSQANASDNRKYGGTGLGLSISRQLIEMQGGQIHIESEVGKGSTFSFDIKLESGSAEKLQERINAEDNIEGAALDGLSILIVDDNEFNRIVAQDTLQQKATVTIVTASGAKEAIALMELHDFDVILMDIQMPGMNGYEATRFIRHHFLSPKKDTPIIALTASVLRTDLDKCKAAGMNSYIPKPFKPAQLLQGIAQATNRILSIKPSVGHPNGDNPKGPVTDMAFLQKFCEGEADKMEKYIALFLKSAPLFLDNMTRSLNEKNFEEIASIVHTFKSRWMMMGMHRANELAVKIEMQCRNDQGGESYANIQSLIIDHEKAMQELQNRA